MRFLIISHTHHEITANGLSAYAPYIKEMNLWLNHVESVEVMAPKTNKKLSLSLKYDRKDIVFTPVPSIALTSVFEVLKTILVFPQLFFKIVNAMRRADHIHLRCPGNMGLIGCIAQIFFPKKRKTAKYAGNWDPNAKQPWSYRLQKYILSSEKLTKNMSAIIYGEWPQRSKNCKTFFTASYSEHQRTEIKQRKYDLPLRFMFVGALVAGKRPLYALKLVHELLKNEIPAELSFYGSGPQSVKLQHYVRKNQLEKFIYLYGNQDFRTLKQAYKKSHFLILSSKSEGWPKVVAEAMWWGVLPVVTRISCLPWMLAEGARGILIQNNLKNDVKRLKKELDNKNALRTKSHKAQLWSRKYTLELFEAEIKKLI
ncbi:glycosyltransferase [Flavimarina sp. Hel_I_48]|uniref:glycosyltransferase n=1 Tax=Flavimarina sp. Hel_I_48 TaxID=1392488 RepID=UPI0004DF7507|nr:glycosyltransferase [Flavimarina sp. Hel_I_48]